MTSARTGAVLLLIGYTLLLAYWMLLGFGRIPGEAYRYNLEPFDTIRMYLDGLRFSPREQLINLAGNIGVFVPFGLLLPIAMRRGFFQSLGWFLLGIAALEITQLVTRRGSLDTDDFILNTAGFALGYAIYHINHKRRGG